VWLEPDDSVWVGPCFTIPIPMSYHATKKSMSKPASILIFPRFSPILGSQRISSQSGQDGLMCHATFTHAVVTMAVLREGSAFKADLHTTASSKNITVFQRPRRHMPRRKQRMILKQYNPTGMPHRNRLGPRQSKIGRNRLFLSPSIDAAWNATDRGDTDVQKKRKQR